MIHSNSVLSLYRLRERDSKPPELLTHQPLIYFGFKFNKDEYIKPPIFFSYCCISMYTCVYICNSALNLKFATKSHNVICCIQIENIEIDCLHYRAI